MPMLTLKDVSERLAVSHMTVRRLVESGAIRASKIGGQLRIRPEDLDLYINQQVVRPYPPAARALAEKPKPKRSPGRPTKSGVPSGGYYPGMKVV